MEILHARVSQAALSKPQAALAYFSLMKTAEVSALQLG
jgi:hypothetical protein